ncbi:unnamed protein product [Didymodactylos carnosus]|uniref:Protein fem-1 homolog B n=1 Tax=Didymodactylos carnosus TaxID=1234261 RepID=A0A8S2EKL3_9BILA|nr:unnamed protein product [Didymodactylos carnosus]CAF4008833.1 unnamed protein product [Didymodactylos carnosus]
MISSYKGHLEVTDYLCKMGCDLNRSNYQAVTALHAAAAENHLLIVQCLTKNGAIINKNSKGLTPLSEAAMNLNLSIVDYFTDDTLNLFSQLQCIEAFELLATSYAGYFVDNSNIEKIYEYLLKAMQLRYSDPNKPILKIVLPPSEMYENHIECNTLEELKLIQFNVDSLFMETFVVRERILGSQHEALIPNLLYIGAVYADQKKFDRCFSLWLRALDVKKSNSELKIDDFLRFAGVFDEMYHEDGGDFPFNVYMVVLRNIIQELISMKYKSKSFNLLTVLYLIVIIAKVMILKTTNEKIEICNLIYHLNSYNFKTDNGSTLLHLCVNENTPVNTIHFKFPCSFGAKLLIDNGADVNAVDRVGNTPLHIIARSDECTNENRNEMLTIVSDLIHNDAHIDTVNDDGQTPLDCAQVEQMRLILRSQTKLSLKCITARTVIMLDLNYSKHLSKALIDFVKLHSIVNK